MFTLNPQEREHPWLSVTQIKTKTLGHFCMRRKDDASGRTELFKKLRNKRETRGSSGEEDVEEERHDDTPLWFHVGNDLVCDVGGS